MLDTVLSPCAAARLTNLVGILGAILPIVAPDFALGQRYEMRVLELPAVYRGASKIRGINNQGDVVGTAVKHDGFAEFAVVWRDGRLMELPLPPERGLLASAVSINNFGRVVGYNNDDRSVHHAVHWPDDWTVEVIHPTHSEATDINDRDVVVGRAPPAVMWRDGSMTSLEPMRWASDVNNLGQVVGNDGQFAVVWEMGEIVRLPGLRPNARSGAGAINDRGRIAGSAQRDTDAYHPVVWEQNIVRELPRMMVHPDPFGSAMSINTKGEIVGTNQSGSHATRPTLRRNNLAVDLNDLLFELQPGWILESTAVRINDAGVITLVAFHQPTFTPYAVRLEPVDTGLTVWGIEPARPGRRNTIQVNHATPGGRVSLLWGTARGEPQALPHCQGAMIDIADPRLAATAVAGPDGRAFIRINIPAPTEGNFILQVVDHRSCEVSPPAWTLIKAKN